MMLYITPMMDSEMGNYIGTKEAATLLGCRPETVSRLVQRGRLQGVMVIGRWVIPRPVLEEFAKTYVAKQGRPPKKR